MLVIPRIAASASLVSRAHGLLAVLALSLGACGDSASGSEKDTSTPSDSTEDTTDTAVDTVDSGGCANGASCNDGDPCTDNDTCDAAGVCRGVAKTCDDALACTRDSCEAGTCKNDLLAGYCLEGAICIASGTALADNACRVCMLSGGRDQLVTLGDGAPCSDGDACTNNDTCQGGACQAGGPLVCTSNDVCIASACDARLGCVETATTASCDDQNPCTVGDACADKACKAGTSALDCDDNDPCTIDACDPKVGCVHDAESKCNDQNPCTNDVCLPTGECVNTKFVGACNDGDPCTSGEVCDAAGTCGGGGAVSCDDGNACTTDACIPRQGCLNLFRTQDCVGETCGPALCDDGESCTINDRCIAGQCFGGKTSQCEFCPVEGTTKANKIVSLLVMADGKTGSGLDIDQNPATCAPEQQCGGGVDNELALLAAFVNPGITDSIENGVVMWIVDLRNATFDGSPFTMAIYDSQTIDPSCDHLTTTCDYNVAALSFDAQCQPYFYFDNAQIRDGKLTAGGTDSLINMVLPLTGGNLLGVTIAKARTEATVSTNAQGQIVALNGIIGGAIPKAQLIEAVGNLDPASFSLPGLTPAAAAALLDQLINSDIDLDGDGLPEAASVAMRIATIPARIVPE